MNFWMLIFAWLIGKDADPSGLSDEALLALTGKLEEEDEKD